MKTNKEKIWLVKLLIFISCTCNGQENSSILQLINKMPTIEFGQLPYWYVEINGAGCLKHDFFLNNRITAEEYNLLINGSIKNKENCFTINTKDDIVSCKNDDIFLTDNFNCRKTSSFKSIKEEVLFCPSIFPVAKSIFNEKFYVVYFWKAMYPESVEYFSLVFNKKGELLSYLTLDYLSTWFPNFPFDSQANMTREVDYKNISASFLPNNLLIVKHIYSMEGGGAYFVIKLNENGHYETCKVWTEEGDIQLELTQNDQYRNYIRVNSEGKKTHSLVWFQVKDKDGYSNVRESPNARSNILYTIQNDDLVFGTLTQNGWCEINFAINEYGNTTESGYIHISRLQKIIDEENEFLSGNR